MADPQDDEKDEEWMKEVYGKEYTGPPKLSDLKDRENSTVKKRPASDDESDEDEKNHDPNAIPTGFTSREAKVWESKAKSIERNWKRKKEEELTCRICGEKGHFTQGCPTTLGVNRRSRGGSEGFSSREKNFKPRFTGSGGARNQGAEKDTRYRFEHENHSGGGRDAYYSHNSRNERPRGPKLLGINKRVDQVDEYRDENMGRQGSSRASNANSLVAAQMQHIAAQRMQHSSGSQHYPSMPDVPPMDMEQRYTSSQADGRWKWEGARNGPNSVPPNMYKEGRGPSDPSSVSPSQVRGPDGTSPYYHGQIPDSMLQEGNTVIPKESDQKQEVRTVFEDQNLPKSLEALEQNLMDEVMKLVKEQNDAEDEEITRHRERTREIHEQYQAKLVALRAEHSKRREELLRHEVQSRVDKYQQPAPSNQYHESAAGPMLGYNENLHDNRGYGTNLGDGHQVYPGGYDTRREEMQYYGNPSHNYNRNQSYDMREAYSGSRMYDSAQRYR